MRKNNFFFKKRKEIKLHSYVPLLTLLSCDNCWTKLSIKLSIQKNFSKLHKMKFFTLADYFSFITKRIVIQQTVHTYFTFYLNTNIHLSDKMKSSMIKTISCIENKIRTKFEPLTTFTYKNYSFE